MFVHPSDPMVAPRPGRLASRVVLGLLLAAFPLFASGETGRSEPAVVSGDTPEEVIAKIGPPVGQAKRGKLTIYYYERGMVDFVDGRVRTAFLVSPEELAKQRAAREAAEQAARETQEADRARLTEAGRRALAEVQADAAFERKTAAEQVAFWQDFTRRYPHTDVSAQLAKAQAAADTDARKQQGTSELKALAERTAAIQARLAQLDADYAASLANWKRNEIDAERAKLDTEKRDILDKLVRLQSQTEGSDARKE